MFSFNRVKVNLPIKKTANGKAKGKIDSFKLKVKELNNLDKTRKDLHSKVSQLRHNMEHGQSRWREDNIPRQLKNIQDKKVAFITGLTCHQRTPVTHCFTTRLTME